MASKRDGRLLASEYDRSLVSVETHFGPMMKTSGVSAHYVNWLSYGPKKEKSSLMHYCKLCSTIIQRNMSSPSGIHTDKFLVSRQVYNHRSIWKLTIGFKPTLLGLDKSFNPSTLRVTIGKSKSFRHKGSLDQSIIPCAERLSPSKFRDPYHGSLQVLKGPQLFWNV